MTKEQEEETIKYLEVLQKEYLEDAKRIRENGKAVGYGTMEDINKLRALYIGFALEMLKQKDKEIKKKDKIIDGMAEYINYLSDELVQVTGKNELKFCDGNKYCKDSNYSCEDCIKQYFERKVEQC